MAFPNEVRGETLFDYACFGTYHLNKISPHYRSFDDRQS
jgi:hypothetical protein